MTMVSEQLLREEGASRTGSGSKRQPRSGSTLAPRTLGEITWRVVEVARPDRIVLLGSAARGEITRTAESSSSVILSLRPL